MDYICNYCGKEFENVQHLKIQHRTLENDERIKCIVNLRKSGICVCTRSYLSFKALKLHVKTCVKEKHKNDKIKGNATVILDTNNCNKNIQILNL